jgi:hypothetical protein
MAIITSPGAVLDGRVLLAAAVVAEARVVGVDLTEVAAEEGAVVSAPMLMRG